MDPPNPFSLKLLKKSATSSEMLLFSQPIKAAHIPELYIYICESLVFLRSLGVENAVYGQPSHIGKLTQCLRKFRAFFDKLTLKV